MSPPVFAHTPLLRGDTHPPAHASIDATAPPPPQTHYSTPHHPTTTNFLPPVSSIPSTMRSYQTPARHTIQRSVSTPLMPFAITPGAPASSTPLAPASDRSDKITAYSPLQDTPRSTPLVNMRSFSGPGVVRPHTSMLFESPTPKSSSLPGQGMEPPAASSHARLPNLAGIQPPASFPLAGYPDTYLRCEPVPSEDADSEQALNQANRYHAVNPTSSGKKTRGSGAPSVNPWDYLVGDAYEAALFAHNLINQMDGLAAGGKLRRRFTKRELEALEVLWSIAKSPSKYERQRLGSWLGVKTKHITVWFQNRRQEEKRFMREPHGTLPPQPARAQRGTFDPVTGKWRTVPTSCISGLQPPAQDKAEVVRAISVGDITRDGWLEEYAKAYGSKPYRETLGQSSSEGDAEAESGAGGGGGAVGFRAGSPTPSGLSGRGKTASGRPNAGTGSNAGAGAKTSAPGGEMLGQKPVRPASELPAPSGTSRTAPSGGQAALLPPASAAAGLLPQRGSAKSLDEILQARESGFGPGATKRRFRRGSGESVLVGEGQERIREILALMPSDPPSAGLAELAEDDMDEGDGGDDDDDAGRKRKGLMINRPTPRSGLGRATSFDVLASSSRAKQLTKPLPNPNPNAHRASILGPLNPNVAAGAGAGATAGFRKRSLEQAASNGAPQKRSRSHAPTSFRPHPNPNMHARDPRLSAYRKDSFSRSQSASVLPTISSLASSTHPLSASTRPVPREVLKTPSYVRRDSASSGVSEGKVITPEDVRERGKGSRERVYGGHGGYGSMGQGFPGSQTPGQGQGRKAGEEKDADEEVVSAAEMLLQLLGGA
ncbi:hypothetical protein IAT38_004213 [Cryptococcus sp. DSM 104549]